jgi:hypothetical protein
MGRHGGQAGQTLVARQRADMEGGLGRAAPGDLAPAEGFGLRLRRRIIGRLGLVVGVGHSVSGAQASAHQVEKAIEGQDGERRVRRFRGLQFFRR